MYGVPSNLPLQKFVGVQINQIALGQYQIQFHFSGAGSISAQSRWELRDSSGQVIDGACEHAERDCYRVHKIIDVKPVRFTIEAPRSFTLYFQSGHALTIFDDSDAYESFSVHLESGASIFI